MSPSKSTKKKAIANPSGRPRGRPRGKVSANRLRELKAARDAHNTLVCKSRRDRIVADEDIPGALRTLAPPLARRIITRACEVRLKYDWEQLERSLKSKTPNHAALSGFPWTTRFVDGTFGPRYHGNGIWECNQLMLA
ncbi:uncharacterized protein RAG0_10001 [Rhynchosporium agropyri]|uniref:Uncharacterized protein n=1 Tax=Rhynchosporium agropyri TaxID=914238 RepID=A0A1E1KXZ4_9HELO|nr:uncharacterized protein RAG0_10001 [Rhynchosporium agropyri]